MLVDSACGFGIGYQLWSDPICCQRFALKIGTDDGSNYIGIGRFEQASWAPAMAFRVSDLLTRTSVEEIRSNIVKKYQFKPYMDGALRSSAPGRDILLCGSKDNGQELSLYAATPNDWRCLVSLTAKFTCKDARVVGLATEHLEILAWSVLDQIIQRISDARLSVAN